MKKKIIKKNIKSNKLKKYISQKINIIYGDKIILDWSNNGLIEISYRDISEDSLENIVSFIKSISSLDRFDTYNSLEVKDITNKYSNFIEILKKEISLLDDKQEFHEGISSYDIGINRYKGNAYILKRILRQCISQFSYQKFNSQYMQGEGILSHEDIKRTGYLNNNYDELLFVGSEGRMDYVLSPAVCLNVYKNLENSILDIDKNQYYCIEVYGEAHRNEREGANNTNRLQKFTVHELIFFGNEKALQYVEKELLIFIKEFFLKLGILKKLEYATDIFFGNNEKELLVSQLLNNNKIEVVSHNNISIGSLNKHHFKFTHEYNISSKASEIKSMCVGFGIDRIIYEISQIYTTEEFIKKIRSL